MGESYIIMYTSLQAALFEHEQTFAALLQRVPQVGALRWIGVRPRYRAPLQTVEQVLARADGGLHGDHARPGKRAVTLIQAEHLQAVAQLLGRDAIAPELLRRNLVVSGINLIALKRARFAIGAVVFEGTGSCDPCSRMEAALGPGGFSALRGHGGITARVLEGGVLTIGDSVRLLAQG
jgi:MOSC domain-containing protein YiiM